MASDPPDPKSSFRPGRPGLRKLLGDHEAEIMEAVWQRGEGARVTVREIFEDLGPRRQVAYTTVMTVMTNLAKKGVLASEKTGKAHVYWAPLSCEQFTETAVARIVDELMNDFGEPALAHFARHFVRGLEHVRRPRSR